MSDPLEQKPWWPEALADMRRLPLRHIAREHGTTVAALEETLRRLGLIGSPAAVAPVSAVAAPPDVVAAHLEEQEPVPPMGATGPGDGANPPEQAASATPRSVVAGAATASGARARIAALESLLGVEPDGVVAKRAGVARKTVVEYRKLKGIAAYRGDAGASSPAPVRVAAAASTARSARANVAAPVSPAPAPSSVPNRSSRLDAFLELVGVLPDREVAQRAGMSTENVRMYRARRGIPARWRGEGDDASGEAVALRAPVASSAPSSAATPARVAVAPTTLAVSGSTNRPEAAAVRTAPRIAWQIFASLPDGERRTFGIVGHDLVEAVRRAETELRAQGWVIDGLRRIGEALEG